MISWVLSSVLAAAPLEGRFVLEVAGLPVAELRVWASATKYIYESTHFLEEGPREHHLELALGEGPQPEVLALLRRPAPGCREVREERTAAIESLCVERSSAREVSGTLAGEPFLARYDGAGALADITVGAARWLATKKATTPPLESPFVRGLEVPPGELRLEPSFAGARWLAHAPRGVGDAARVGRVRCLVLAREELGRRPGARVAVGLVIEQGRAFPHAWLTEGGVALDPSVLEGDPVLQQRRYLEVPAERSGAFFLQLFEGALRLKAK